MKLKNYLLVLLALVLSIVLVACNDDEDSDNNDFDSKIFHYDENEGNTDEDY